MTLDEKIHLYTQKLPYSFQEEVFDFVQYLLVKAERQERRDWASFSLDSAMRGMEDEPDLYNLSDIRDMNQEFASEDDWIDYRLEHDPHFLRRIAQARASLQAGQGVRLEDANLL